MTEIIKDMVELMRDLDQPVRISAEYTPEGHGMASHADGNVLMMLMLAGYLINSLADIAESDLEDVFKAVYAYAGVHRLVEKISGEGISSQTVDTSMLEEFLRRRNDNRKDDP